MKPLDLIDAGTQSIKDKDFNVKFTHTGSREIDQLVDVYNTMVDQIRTERIEIKEQHFFLEKLINASPNGIVIFDYEGRISDINPAAQKMFQLSNPKQTIPAHIKDKIWKLPLNDSQIFQMDGIQKLKFHKSEFLHKGFKRPFIIIEDISNEILQSEKKAYGKVIRMMAHEVNNSIGAVNSLLHSIKEYYESDDTVTNALDVSIDRNDKLNKFMSNFSEVIKLPAPHKEPIDLNELLEKVVTLFKPDCHKRNIEIKIKGEHQSKLDADIYQFEQVLINVVKNAIESIDKNGNIDLEISNQPHALKIKDNGIGIDENIREKLFTPFFSTKATGQGIGLTMIKEILHNHNFEFSLKTESDGKTHFLILF